jgi:hypothetical protein
MAQSRRKAIDVSSDLAREAEPVLFKRRNLIIFMNFERMGVKPSATPAPLQQDLFREPMTLKDYVHKLAYNQHGGIMGYIRNSVGTLEGPRILDVFVVDQKLTCAELEKAAARGDDDELDREMGFRGRVVTWTDGPLLRQLDCGEMLIGLDDRE